jgi:hypothetical protein
LLVSRNVTAQALSGSSNIGTNSNVSNNTSTNKTSRTQKQKKSATFNIKQQIVVFLELNCKERKKKHVMYVNGGRVMAVMSI